VSLVIAVTRAIATDMLLPCVNVTFLISVIHAIALAIVLARGYLPAAPLDDMTMNDIKMDHRRKP
jgi:hypothetical protein